MTTKTKLTKVSTPIVEAKLSKQQARELNARLADAVMLCAEAFAADHGLNADDFVIN
jgi:hypothetical protein